MCRARSQRGISQAKTHTGDGGDKKLRTLGEGDLNMLVRAFGTLLCMGI